MDRFLLVNVIFLTAGALMNLDILKQFPNPDIGPDVNIMLLGKTGNGRSALGNNILGRYEFESRVSPTFVTRHSQLRRSQVGSRKIYVVDTPGLYVDLSTGEAENILKDLVNTFSLCPRGYHAVLIVMNAVNRISKEELDTIKFLRIIFGDTIFKYVIFVFTHRDVFEANIDLEDNSTEEFVSYIDNQPGDMKNFIERAGQRVLFINILEQSKYRNRLFHVLIRMIDNLMKSHNSKPKYYFDDAAEKLKADRGRKL